MPPQARGAAEAAIKQVLLHEWDPLAVHGIPGPRGEYDTHAHEVYDLLERGASDVQVERYLRYIERHDMHHPELASRDLSALLRALRDLERTII